MKEKGFYPNVPVMDFPNEATVLTNENLQDGERCKYAYFDMTDVVYVYDSVHGLRSADQEQAPSRWYGAERETTLIVGSISANHVVVVDCILRPCYGVQYYVVGLRLSLHEQIPSFSKTLRPDISAVLTCFHAGSLQSSRTLSRRLCLRAVQHNEPVYRSRSGTETIVTI
jgi:hypothetical protein